MGLEGLLPKNAHSIKYDFLEILNFTQEINDSIVLILWRV